VNKTCFIRMRVTQKEKDEITKEAGGKGNVSQYLLNLHREKFKVIDPEGLKKLIYTIFDKKVADELVKKHLGVK
jgi:hypothetical protein